MCLLDKILDEIEEETMSMGSMLNLFQVGIALKVLEDRLWNIDSEIAQRCSDLQHKILEK